MLDQVLKGSWDAIKVSTFLLPGCTEPRTTIECTLKKDGDSFVLTYSKGSKKIKGGIVRITGKQARDITDSIRKHYRLAAAERSFSEELDLLSLKDRRAKMKEHEKKTGGRPIGGFARSFISVTIASGAKTYKFSEEFGSAGGDNTLVEALKSYSSQE